MSFSQFSPQSKIWVYTADREFSVKESAEINTKLQAFINEWAAHGSSLYGGAEIVENRFIVLCVDESKVSASGCSIDTSVGFIKSIGNQLNIDFFNRLNFWIVKDGELVKVAFSNLLEYQDSWYIIALLPGSMNTDPTGFKTLNLLPGFRLLFDSYPAN